MDLYKKIKEYPLTPSQLEFSRDAMHLLESLTDEVYVEWTEEHGRTQLNVTWDEETSPMVMASLIIDKEDDSSDRPVEVCIELYGNPEVSDEPYGELTFSNAVGFWLDADDNIELYHAVYGDMDDDHMVTKHPESLHGVVDLFKQIINMICLNKVVNQRLVRYDVYLNVDKDMALYPIRKKFFKELLQGTMITVY